MPIAILDAYSGISGDMTLGALVDVGLDSAWLRALPVTLGIPGVTVRIQDVKRAGIACKKVDFDIPPQPHGRHLSAIRALLAQSPAPPSVREKADAAFTAIANTEAEIHGTTVDRVHLHEVGAVDAILDVVGVVWGFELLGVRRAYCTTIALGDGTVTAAHGLMPVPAPATLRLLEGRPVRPGPENSGELVTPTGAALVKILAEPGEPGPHVPLRSGFGAGTKDPEGRANALRITLAEPVRDGAGVERLVTLTADVDDMSPEYLAAAAEALRAEGALDVVLFTTAMKKGRLGCRIELLATPALADRLEDALFLHSATIGVRRAVVERRALPRQVRTVRVEEHDVTVKIVTLPDGGRRAKAEFEDVRRTATASGRPAVDVAAAAERAALADETTR